MNSDDVVAPPTIKFPVEGLNVSFDDDTFRVDRLPVVVFAIPT
jgi:hypothetical protein